MIIGFYLLILQQMYIYEDKVMILKILALIMEVVKFFVLTLNMNINRKFILFTLNEKFHMMKASQIHVLNNDTSK